MGMYTSSISGQSDAVRRDESDPDGGKQCSNPEKPLQQKLIMKRKIFFFKSVIRNDFGDAGMSVRKFLVLAGCF